LRRIVGTSATSLCRLTFGDDVAFSSLPERRVSGHHLLRRRPIALEAELWVATLLATRDLVTFGDTNAEVSRPARYTCPLSSVFHRRIWPGGVARGIGGRPIPWKTGPEREAMAVLMADHSTVQVDIGRTAGFIARH